MTDTSTVERFRPYAIYDGGVRSGMEPCDFGGWVRYDDYAALLAERDALQAKLDVANGTMEAIAYDAYVSHDKPKAMYKAWRAIAVARIDMARSYLAQLTKEDEG